MIIKPKLKRQNTVKFQILKGGDVFMFDGLGTGLWIKCGEGDSDQTAINLADGEMTTDNCDSAVILVNATMNWSRIKPPAKKTK